MANLLSNLAQNKLLLQYLAGAGADISAGNPIGANVNAVTNQAITAQNFTKLLSKMLGGNIPEGGKLTMDSKGMSMTIPRNVFGGTAENTALATEGSKLPGGSGIDWNMINPSPSPLGVSGADLAGLTPDMISQALQFKFASEEMGQKKITDLVDMIYKLGLTKKALGGEPLDQPFPIEVPGIGKVTNRQWASLPSDDREYAIFVAQAKALGDSDIMTKQEYMELSPTDREKFLRAAMKDPRLMEAAKELARESRTQISIGEAVSKAVQTKEALNAVENINYIDNPKGLSKEITDMIDSSDFKRAISEAATTQDMSLEDARTTTLIKRIEARLSSWGNITNVDWTGNTVTWTIALKDGTTKEFRYGVGPRPTR